MAVVGFAVLFAGIVAPQAATAATAALLTFVLPVAVAAAGLADRAPPAGLDAGRRLLHHRLHAGVAAPVARQSCAAGSPRHSAVARLADARAAGQPDRDAHDVVAAELGLLRRQFRARPIRRRAPRRAPSRSPSSWAGSSGSPNNATMSRTEVVDRAVGACRHRQVAETLHQTRP